MEKNVVLKADNESVCMSVCHYKQHNNNDLSALYYSMLISAKNALRDGYSDGKSCGNVPMCKFHMFHGCKTAIVTIVREAYKHTCMIVYRY